MALRCPEGVQHASSRNFSFVTATVPFSAIPPSVNEVENGARWPGSQDLGNIVSLHRWNGRKMALVEYGFDFRKCFNPLRYEYASGVSIEV